MWNNQKKNCGSSIKLIVWFHDDQKEKVKTFHAFKQEEESGRAIPNMTKRILGRAVLGKYRTAIFYNNGSPVEKWNNGVKE